MRRPSGDDAASIGGGSMFGRRPSNARTNAETTTSAMIIPSKSTIATEEIETPFERPISTASSIQQNDGASIGEDEDDEDDDEDLRNGRASAIVKGADKDDGGYYENSSYGRASPGSIMSPAVSRSNTVASTREGSESAERVRRDYEFKVAQMQTKINGLENDLADALRQRDDGQDSVRRLNEELEDLRIRSSEQSKALRDLERDLDDARAQVSLGSPDGVGSGGGGGGGDPAAMAQLREDLNHVMDDLTELSTQNDELQAERDADRRTMRDMENEVREWKRKYEQAKTELRSVKGRPWLIVPIHELTVAHSVFIFVLATTAAVRRSNARICGRRHSRHPRHGIPERVRRLAYDWSIECAIQGPAVNENRR